MSDKITNIFPKGLLMLGRFFTLSLLSIFFRYFDVKHFAYRIPDNHFTSTVFSLMYLVAGLLLLSKKVEYIRIVPYIIGVGLIYRVILILVDRQITTNKMILLSIGIAFNIFLIFYIYKSLALYKQRL
jgi:hypothetical protein